MNANFESDQAASLSVRGDQDSTFLIQKNSKQINRAWQEILILKSAKDPAALPEKDQRSYEAAMWEGWPAIFVSQVM